MNPLCKRIALFVLFIGIVTLASGCAHPAGPRFRNGSGDAGKFIVREAVERGAKPIATRGMAPLSGSWSYAADNSGVMIRMSSSEFPAVEALLLRAFGVPQLGPLDGPDGRRVGAYKLTPRGAVLEFGRDSQWTLVVVLREPNEQEIAADFIRRLQ